MALTEDYEYKARAHADQNKFLAGAVDTYYKGAIASIGTDGYIKVGADVINEIPFGVFVDGHVSDGSSHLGVSVESGRIFFEKKTLHVSTILFTDESGGSNAAYNSKYFILYNGETAYYVWFDVNSTGTDPAIDGATGIEVDIATSDVDTAVGSAVQVAVDAEGDFGAALATATVTVTATNRGYTIPTVDGDLSTVVTITNTVYSGAMQSDVGELFFCADDDGVVYAAGKSNSNVPVGLCIGIDGNSRLVIDTYQKALS
jgi:hypothetical protein